MDERTFSDALAGFSLKEKLGWELRTLGPWDARAEVVAQVAGETSLEILQGFSARPGMGEFKCSLLLQRLDEILCSPLAPARTNLTPP